MSDGMTFRKPPFPLGRHRIILLQQCFSFCSQMSLIVFWAMRETPQTVEKIWHLFLICFVSSELKTNKRGFDLTQVCPSDSGEKIKDLELTNDWLYKMKWKKVGDTRGSCGVP